MGHRGYVLWSIVVVVSLFLLWQLSLIAATLGDLVIGIPSVVFDHPNVSGRSIPPIIHQMWKNSDLSSYPINTSHSMWRQMYPDYTIRLWTDKDLDRLISSKEYEYLFSTYRSYPFNIQRADLARLVVLHSEGGIYADLDVFPRDRSIDKLRSSGASFIIPRSSSDSSLINHFLVSERHSPILDFILHRVPYVAFHQRIFLVPYLQVFSTGSIFLTRILREWMEVSSREEKEELWILSSEAVSCYADHNTGRSWHMFDGYIFNEIDAHRKLFIGFVVFSLISLCLFVKYRKKACITTRLWRAK